MTKTTVDLPSDLVERAKSVAKARRTTLRALVEDGLRQVIDRSEDAPDYEPADLSFGGKGLRPELREGGWPAVRDLIYPEQLGS